MEKSANSLKKDALLHRGLIWVRDASFDYRQGSGVRFGGKYMTVSEYNAYKAFKKLHGKRRGTNHGH